MPAKDDKLMHALRELSVAPIALAGLTFALDAAWAQGTEYRAGKIKVVAP